VCCLCCHCCHAAPCMSGHGVLPASPPPPRCPLHVGPWCAAHVTAAAALPIVLPLSACWAMVCCLHCYCHHAAPCMLGHGVLPASLLLPHCPLHVGPWCAACITAAAALPVVSPLSVCQAAVCCLCRHHHHTAHCVAIECVSGYGVLPMSPLPLCCPLSVRLWCAAHVATAVMLPIVSPSSGCMSGCGVLPVLSPPPCCLSCCCQVVACNSVLLPTLPPLPCCSSCHWWAIVCCVAVCCCPHCCHCSHCAACHLTVG